MLGQPIQNIVIVGGGTAGWNAAALLVRMMSRVISITLVESEEIGIVGVGEATIPPVIRFNNALGLNEDDFLKSTQGSIKLGIQFENWGELGDSYMHAFGDVGRDFAFCPFHNFWVRSQQLGIEADFWDFSPNYQAAVRHKFGKVSSRSGTSDGGLPYAYHFDAGLYAKYLRGYCESQGVTRVEGIVDHSSTCSDTGFIKSLTLKSGKEIEGDLFLDCSGFRGLLIEQALQTGYEEWSHWLPCDRAVAVPSESTGPIRPYTRSIAHKAGWQWNIPLQHRTGNGHVYCSSYVSDDEACHTLLSHLEGPPLTEPRQIPFKTGRRKLQWNKNVVALGLASGFLEPLESTSIHLIQTGIRRLMDNFPHQGIRQIDIDAFNKQSKLEFEQIRDFIILHYKINQRTDSQFWVDCRNMSIPDTLEQKIELFKHSGRVLRYSDELFAEVAWYQVMLGQGLIPDDYHPIADSLSEQQMLRMFAELRAMVGDTVSQLPTHDQFLASVTQQQLRTSSAASA